MDGHGPPSKYTQPIKYDFPPGNSVIRMAGQGTCNPEDQDPPMPCTIWVGWIIHFTPYRQVSWNQFIEDCLEMYCQIISSKLKVTAVNYTWRKTRSHGHFKILRTIHAEQSIPQTVRTPTPREHTITWGSMSPPSMVQNSQSESGFQKPWLTPLVENW